MYSQPNKHKLEAQLLQKHSQLFNTFRFDIISVTVGPQFSLKILIRIVIILSFILSGACCC